MTGVILMYIYARIAISMEVSGASVGEQTR